MVSSRLANTHVKLLRGAAMLEVDLLFKDTNLTVAVGGVGTHIEKDGLYNFDAGQPAVSSIGGFYGGSGRR